MEIELPNGQIAEFPDNMPMHEIESVLSKQFPQQHVNSSEEMINKRFPNMPDFLKRGLLNLAKEEVQYKKPDSERGTATGAFLRSAIRTPLEGAENIASLIGLPINKDSRWPSFIEESESDKSHPFSQLGGSLVGFLAPGAGSVAALRSIPSWGSIVSKAAPSLLRRLPVYGAEGAAIGSAFSPEGQRGEGALTGGLLGSGISAIPSVGKGLSSLKERFLSLRNLDKLREEGKISEEQYKNALANEESLKEFARSKNISSDIDRLKSELPELKAQEKYLQEEISSMPEEDLSNRLPYPTGEESVTNAEYLLRTNEQKQADIENKLSKELGFGNVHDVRIGRALKEQIKNTKEQIGSEYESIKTDLKDTHVELPRGRDVKQITEDLTKAVKKGGYSSEEVKKLATELDSVSNGKRDLIPANNFLEMYRSTKGLANKAMRNSRKEGIDALERQHWEKQYKELSETSEKMNSILKNHMGDDLFNRLERANHRWKTEVTPLYGNKHYYLIQEGKLTKNIMDSLRGDEPGNVLIRNMIKKDPNLIKNVIGQKYSKKPSDLYNFNELAQDYISSAPDNFKKLISDLVESINKVNKSMSGLEEAKTKHYKLKSESERINEAFSESKKSQELRSKKQNQLKELKDKISEYDRIIPELKKKAKQSDITLKRKIELENKISRAEKDRSKLINRTFGLGIGLGSYYFGKGSNNNLLKP